MDKKISAAQLAAGNMLASMSDEIDALKKGKSVVDNAYSLDVLNPSSSATPMSSSEPIYGMPPGYFAGQMPPPSSVQTKPVRPALWCLVRLHLHRSHRFLVRLPLAELMNWWPTHPLALQQWAVHRRDPVPIVDRFRTLRKRWHPLISMHIVLLLQHKLRLAGTIRPISLGPKMIWLA